VKSPQKNAFAILNSSLLLTLALNAVGCQHSSPDLDEAEVIEVRTWDEGCRSELGGRGAFDPDTIAYPSNRRDSFRVVALGGCVGEWFYEQERRLYSVLDSIGVPDSVISWPYDVRLMLTAERSDYAFTPSPLDSALTVVLAVPDSPDYFMFGFSATLGMLWADVHLGPHFRLTKVERVDSTDTVELNWSNPDRPMGGPRDPSLLDLSAPITAPSRPPPPSLPRP